MQVLATAPGCSRTAGAILLDVTPADYGHGHEQHTPDYDPSQVRRSVEVSDLVGAAEIAERLHLSHSQNVHTWRRRYSDFPEPVARLSIGLIWSWKEIQAWARTSGRLRPDSR
jgi:hypothetical protein